MDFLFALIVLVACVAPFIFVATIVEVLWDGLTEAQRESFLRKMGVK